MCGVRGCRKIVPNAMPIAPPIASAEKKLELRADASTLETPGTRTPRRCPRPPPPCSAGRHSGRHRAVHGAVGQFSHRQQIGGQLRWNDIAASVCQGLCGAQAVSRGPASPRLPSPGKVRELPRVLGTSRTGSCDGSTCFAAGSAVSAAALHGWSGFRPVRGNRSLRAPPQRGCGVSLVVRGRGQPDRSSRSMYRWITCSSSSGSWSWAAAGRGVGRRMFGERRVSRHARRRFLGQQCHRA